MEVTCNIIKDLLPLYLENMLSDDSHALVEEHIRNCKECGNYLNEMNNFNEMPLDRNASPLKKIKSSLYKKKIQTVIFSVMISFALFVILIAFVTAPEYIPYSEKNVAINETGNGTVLVQFDDTVYGYNVSAYKSDDNSGYVYHITAWNSIWNRITKKSNPKYTVINPNGENVVAVYYYQTDGSEDILIYGKDINPDGGIVTLPRLYLTYYALIAAVMAVVCGLIMIIGKHNKKTLNVTMKLFLLPASYLLGHLMIRGFTASSYTAKRDFYAILLVTALFYAAFLILVDYVKYYKNARN